MIKSEESFTRQHTGYGHLRSTGSHPCPDIPLGNHQYNNAAVVIIGGGIAGMNMAIDLLTKQGIKSFVIIEKGGGFGGTWRDVRAPGNMSYS
jgi:hypothetical protein